MCGRFTLSHNRESLQLRFGFAEPEADTPLSQRYNIAPTQEVPVVVMENGVRIVKLMRWGLIPHWAKDESIGNRMINARAETISEKASFKNAFKHRRCLVMADGFYEWAKRGSSKHPMRFVLKSREPFAFAGLWDRWIRPDSGEVVLSFTIITTAANELLATIHERMPVILNKEDEDIWLDPKNDDVERLKILLKQYPAELMRAYEVSTLVNSPAHDTKDCINPLE